MKANGPSKCPLHRSVYALSIFMDEFQLISFEVTSLLKSRDVGVHLL
jgi:hypothetical protein